MYNAKIHVLRENTTTNNSRNSLPVLSAIWTFWKTTAAKHIFGDISNFFFQKWRLEIISVEFSHYSSANFRCWETKKKSFFMIHYPLYNNCHSKKVTKNSSFLLLVGFVLYIWPDIQRTLSYCFFDHPGYFFKKIHISKFHPLKIQVNQVFFLKKRKNGYGGCCTYWFFVAIKKSGAVWTNPFWHG